MNSKHDDVRCDSPCITLTPESDDYERCVARNGFAAVGETTKQFHRAERKHSREGLCGGE